MNRAPDADAAWSRGEFEARLRALEPRYHIHHEFQRRMDAGRLDRDAIRGWVANRYYYQIQIPRKDAAILANCPDRAVRRRWIQRLLDQDGQGGEAGGIEAWTRLGAAVGLEREELEDQRFVLPGVRFAVDAYLNFAKQATWEEAVCSSLSELFAPSAHARRLANWPQHYPWIDAEGYDYFRSRLAQARRDVEHGLEVVLERFRTPAQQRRALEILRFKLDVLWCLLDALWIAYVAREPARPPQI